MADFRRMRSSGTELEEHLRWLDVSTVALCGCNFPNCPRTTLYEASERDFRLVLVRDALSGLYERGARELERIGVHLLDAKSLAAALLAPGDDDWERQAASISPAT